MRRVERETRATYASPPLHSNNEKGEDTKVPVQVNPVTTKP